MEGDILVLNFTGVKNVFSFSVQVKNDCLMSFHVASLSPFFLCNFHANLVFKSDG